MVINPDISKFQESTEKLENPEQIKKQIQVEFHKLNKLLEKMIKRADRDFDKEKEVEAIRTDWQTHYRGFVKNFTDNNVSEALESLRLMLLQVDFDKFTRKVKKQMEIIEKWHGPVTTSIEIIRGLVNKLNNFDKDELKEAKVLLEIKDFELMPLWFKSDADLQKEVNEAAEGKIDLSRLSKVDTMEFPRSAFDVSKDVPASEDITRDDITDDRTVRHGPTTSQDEETREYPAGDITQRAKPVKKTKTKK